MNQQETMTLRYYYVLLNIGNPPKLFDLDIDTGSDLTWVPCDAPCNDPCDAPCNGCTKTLVFSFSKNYKTGPAELLFNDKTTCVKGINFIFDSGSSYTYFNSEAYPAILDLIRKDLKGKPLKDTKEDKSLPVCWKDKKPSKTVHDVKKYFKTITLRFGSRKKGQLFQIQPESYLIITEKGNVCLGILNGTEIGLQNYNIIGDISFQGIMVIYDNEKQMIGWIPSDCDKLPNVGRDDGGNLSEEEAYPRGFGLIGELFSGTDASKNKKDREL
ncbi:aspartic proteinase Asp1-like [Raphanus sativus]|uniref:Aspartic proteinase Asp1-like n=1 Tax=Raphanus sativus TaxID=3726 RepID=A0A6J0JM90_RAPSA|nr:aspartic proteinase Asp1-like [Raphanus sativus]